MKTTSPTQNLPPCIHKRSHSQSDSDTSENTNDLSKKSKYLLTEISSNIFSFLLSRLNEAYRNENDDTSDEDSRESTKTGEQATTD